MWKDPIPFYLPSLCLKLERAEACHFNGKEADAPHPAPIFTLGRHGGTEGYALIMSFWSRSFERPHLKARGIGRMLTLGVPGRRNALQSLQNESWIFLQNELPVLTGVSHFIYVVVTHPFCGIGEATFPERGRKRRKMCELPLVLSCIQADWEELQGNLAMQALETEIIRIISFSKVHFYADGWNVSGQDLLDLGLDSVSHLVSADLALLANVTAVKSWRGIPALSEDVFTK